MFLDTQVFREYGHNLKAKPLQTFLQLLKDQVFILHTTDITIAEIDRQIQELAVETAVSYGNSIKRIRSWQFSFRESTLSQDELSEIDPLALASEAKKSFRLTLSTEWKPRRHRALEIPPSTVFDRYFNREAPFDEKESKEFPDAFVVEVLDQWCLSNDSQMYVVTRDKAMQRAAARTASLISLPSLDELMQAVAEGKNPDVLDRVGNLLQSKLLVEKIESTVCVNINEVIVIYSGYLFDGEVVDQRVNDYPLEIIDFQVLSVFGDEIGVIVKLKVPLAVNVQYKDMSDAFYDKEDNEYIGGEIEETEIENEVTIRVFVTVNELEPEKAQIEIVTKEVRISEPPEA